MSHAELAKGGARGDVLAQSGAARGAICRRFPAGRNQDLCRIAPSAFAEVVAPALGRAVIWPYLVGTPVMGAVIAGGWWLWKTDRLIRGGDRTWRREGAVETGHRALPEADAMDGPDFEEFMAGPTCFSGPAGRCAVQNGVLAVHRDDLGQWNNGAALSSLASINGSGQGDRQHRARRKKTYG